MKRWHLTIKDNEKNEIVTDYDTSVILGSYTTDDDIIIIEEIDDTAKAVGKVIYSLAKLVREIANRQPAVILSYMMYKLLDEKDEIEENIVKC